MARVAREPPVQAAPRWAGSSRDTNSRYRGHPSRSVVGRSILEDPQHLLELEAVVLSVVIFLVQQELDARERGVPGFGEGFEPVGAVVIVTALGVEHHRVHGVDREMEVGLGDGVHGWHVLLEVVVSDLLRKNYTSVNTVRFENVSLFLGLTSALLRF